jgi:hypothetical protein
MESSSSADNWEFTVIQYLGLMSMFMIPKYEELFSFESVILMLRLL